MEKKFIGNGLEISDLEKIAKIVKDYELGKIEIKNDEFELCIEGRKCPPPPPHMPVAAPMMQPMVNVTAAAATEVAPAPKAEAVPEGNVVKSPIVGTFYAAPSPDKAPFVKVGDTVKKGDVIMIIESMKLMNEVQSDFDGTVAEILVNNGDAVEFDQPIMIIR